MNVLERAEHAKALLENETFKTVLAEVKADLVAGLETSGFQDVDTHHELTLTLQLLKRLRSKLQNWIDDGTQEQKRLDAVNWRDQIKQVWRRP